MKVSKIPGKNNNGLVEYAKAQVGLPYWYGTFGQIATKWLYDYNKARLPEFYKADDFYSQFGKRVHDCVGLIKGYMWSKTPTSTPEYNANQDVGTFLMYDYATKKGNIYSIDISVNGLLLFTANKGHVGVYCIDGHVYQALGHAWGVVKTPFKKSDWGYWAECPYIEYDKNNEIPIEDFDINNLPLLQYSSLGKAVKVWQEIVETEADGIFGYKTKQATIKFQKVWFPNQPNEWDGVVGEKTWNKGLSSLY